MAVRAGRPVVTVNGQALVAWTFDYNNVLAWADEAGYSAWLQCLVLPGGPVFVGKITNGDAYEGARCFPCNCPRQCICSSTLPRRPTYERACDLWWQPLAMVTGCMLSGRCMLQEGAACSGDGNL